MISICLNSAYTFSEEKRIISKEDSNLVIAVIVALGMIVLLSGFGMMEFSNYGGYGGMYGMMGGLYGGFGFMALFGWLLMILIAVTLVLFIIWLVKQLSEGGGRK